MMTLVFRWVLDYADVTNNVAALYGGCDANECDDYLSKHEYDSSLSPIVYDLI